MFLTLVSIMVVAFLAAADPPPSYLYAVTNNNYLGISADNGRTWRWFDSAHGLPGSHLYCVRAVNGRVYVGAVPGIFITADNGKTWNTTLKDIGINSIFVLPDRIYTGTNGHGLAKSVDNGNSWVYKDTSSGMAANSSGPIFAHPDGRLYAAYGSKLSISVDKGDTWRVAELMGSINSVYATEAYIYLGMGGGLAVSADNGKTWTNRLTSYNVQSVFVDSGRIYVGTTAGLGMSDDNAATWRWVNATTGLISSDVYKVFARGNWTFAGTKSGGLSISEDGGETWLTRGLVDTFVYDVFAVWNT